MTNQQFDTYSDQIKGVQSPIWAGPQVPRTSVTWQQALDYCNLRYPNGGTLTSEAQWEYAARGWNSLLYPWGNVFAGNLDQVIYAGNSKEPQAVMDPDSGSDDTRTAGVSWVGAHDMAGNVREWTTTIYDQTQYAYPNVNTDAANSLTNVTNDRVVRGGSYFSADVTFVTTTTRESLKPKFKYDDVGFRCTIPFGIATYN